MRAIPTEPPLAGWRVGVTADRRADQQIEALRRRGADVVHGCTMRTLDLSDDARLLGRWWTCRRTPWCSRPAWA
jgi:uroporphyrinogen-III synthase